MTWKTEYKKGGQSCDDHCKNTVRYIHICTSNFNSEILFTLLLQSWLENNFSLKARPDGKGEFGVIHVP